MISTSSLSTGQPEIGAGFVVGSASTLPFGGACDPTGRVRGLGTLAAYSFAFSRVDIGRELNAAPRSGAPRAELGRRAGGGPHAGVRAGAGEKRGAVLGAVRGWYESGPRGARTGVPRGGPTAAIIE